MPVPAAPPASEDALLARIDTLFPRAHPNLLLGRGDDCAVLPGGEPLCVSTDLFVEGVHFRRAYFPAEAVGHKALAVNLSDLAAMGAQPVAFALSLGLPKDVDEAWVEDMLHGMSRLARRYDLPLLGGDVSAAGTLLLSLSVWGRQVAGCAAADGGGFLRRGAVRAGDVLFCVGTLGLARVGLHLLEAASQAGEAAVPAVVLAEIEAAWPAACAAHLRPEPQVAAGLALAGLGERVRLMDVSDGLARDLPRMLGVDAHMSAPGSYGASLALEPHMLAGEVRRYAAAHGLDAVREALCGGEDYALLGACAPDAWTRVRQALPAAWRLGEVTATPGVRLRDSDCFDLPGAGFDHFAICQGAVARPGTH